MSLWNLQVLVSHTLGLRQHVKRAHRSSLLRILYREEILQVAYYISHSTHEKKWNESGQLLLHVVT